MTVVPLLASTRLGRRVAAAHLQDFVVRNFHILGGGLDWILDHARAVTTFGILIVLGLCLSMFWLTPDNRLVEMIPRSNDSYRAIRHLDKVLGGSLSMFVVVEWNENRKLQDPAVLRAIQEVQTLLASKQQLHYPLSVLDLLASLPGKGKDLASRVPLLALVPKDVLYRYVRPEKHRAGGSASGRYRQFAEPAAVCRNRWRSGSAATAIPRSAADVDRHCRCWCAERAQDD